jgi:hypothetical protein
LNNVILEIKAVQVREDNKYQTVACLILALKVTSLPASSTTSSSKINS